MTELLTTAEVAATLRCHEKTVRRMIGRGEIDAHFVAGRWLIAREALPTELPRRSPPHRPPRPRRPGGHFAEIAREMDAA
jgi:excisionase family DNA binding protein